jgi:hypothetical protein
MKAHFAIDLLLLQFQATSLGHTDDRTLMNLNRIVVIPTDAFGHEFAVGVDQEVGSLEFENTFISGLDLEIAVSSSGGLVFGEEGRQTSLGPVGPEDLAVSAVVNSL